MFNLLRVFSFDSLKIQFLTSSSWQNSSSLLDQWGVYTNTWQYEKLSDFLVASATEYLLADKNKHRRSKKDLWRVKPIVPTQAPPFLLSSHPSSSLSLFIRTTKSKYHFGVIQLLLLPLFVSSQNMKLKRDIFLSNASWKKEIRLRILPFPPRPHHKDLVFYVNNPNFLLPNCKNIILNFYMNRQSSMFPLISVILDGWFLLRFWTTFGLHWNKARVDTIKVHHQKMQLFRL